MRLMRNLQAKSYSRPPELPFDGGNWRSSVELFFEVFTICSGTAGLMDPQGVDDGSVGHRVGSAAFFHAAQDLKALPRPLAYSF